MSLKHKEGVNLLSKNAIESVREFVNTQCDMVKHTIGNLNDPKFIHRFIHPVICNIIEECFGYLNTD